MSMAGNRLNYLTADDWVLIQAKAVPQTYKLGDEIIREGGWGDSIYIIRRGEASVELAGTGSRTIVADLGPGDVCGEMAFIEQAKASAAVIAKSEEVQADQISARALAEILEAFPRLSSRFYRSLALVLVQRLRVTTGELAREMALRDRHRSGIPSPFSKIEPAKTKNAD
jgi:CRP-like cAMP-binding protein